jgi:hypothetical protein
MKEEMGRYFRDKERRMVAFAWNRKMLIRGHV